MGNFIDLKISNGDIVFINGTEALVSDRESLVQDIKHQIIETNLMIELIANRNSEIRKQKINQMIEQLETDPRIIPGSIVVTDADKNTLYFGMDTVLGYIELSADDADFIQIE